MLRLVVLDLRDIVRVALVALAAAVVCAGTACADTWHANDLTTYSQGDWGGDRNVQAGAALLFGKYDTVYASTFGVMSVGSTSVTMTFTDAASVLAYLPSAGTPGPLSGSVMDPITTASGVFGGEVLALQLNVDFSDAGFLPANSGLRFGDLVLTGFSASSPLAPLDGLTVRQLLGDVNTLLGGGSSIVSISDLGTLVDGAPALAELNGSFFYGQPSQFAQDHLVAPAAVETATAPLPGGVAPFAVLLCIAWVLNRRGRRHVEFA